jgi:hypothetical protein
MKRVTAILAASICLALIHADSSDFMAKEPKEIWLPLMAFPFILPFCILRNFVRFGCNMTFTLAV